VLLFGIGTRALPSWDSKTGWNNLYRGLAIRRATGPSGHTNSPHPSSRGLFQALDSEGEKAREETVKAFHDLYKKNAAEFPPEAKELSYPIHPVNKLSGFAYSCVTPKKTNKKCETFIIASRLADLTRG
jgi:hypothetical protein